jgi:hypothetical protein
MIAPLPTGRKTDSASPAAPWRIEIVSPILATRTAMPAGKRNGNSVSLTVLGRLKGWLLGVLAL